MRLSLLYKPLVNALRFHLARLCYDYVAQPRTIEHFSFAELKHLVIVKPDGKLGDTQIISLFLDVLKKTCPALQVTVLCNAGIFDIYKEVLGVATVIEVSKRPHFAEIRTIASKLKSYGQVDMLLSTERRMRPRDLYLAHLCHPGIFVGMDERVTCINYQFIKGTPSQHIMSYFLDLLKTGGLKPEAYAYRPLYLQADLLYAKQLFASRQAIGLLPYGAATDKRLPYATLLSTCRYLAEHTEYLIVPLLTDAERETRLKLERDLRNAQVLFLPKVDIRRFAACIACLRGLISVDTSGVHLAVASHVPVLDLCTGVGDEAIMWMPGPLATANSKVFLKKGTPISEISYIQLEPFLISFIREL